MMYPDKNNEKIVVPRHPRREFIHKLSLYLEHAEQPATIRYFRLIINVVLKPNAMDDSKLVVIRSFSSVGEASIYKSLLESSGVPCELLNELTAEVLPIRNEMMPVRLVVNEADARRAEEILGAKFDQEEFDKESAKRRKKP